MLSMIPEIFTYYALHLPHCAFTMLQRAQHFFLVNEYSTKVFQYIIILRNQTLGNVCECFIETFYHKAGTNYKAYRQAYITN